LFASDVRLDLEGTVTGAEGTGRLRVQLFSIGTSFMAAAGVESDGKFQFRSLTPGDYSVAVVRDGLGEVRRTVVVSPALADPRGVVAAEIPFRADGSGAMISVHRAAVPQDAADWYLQARDRLARQDAKGALKLLRRAVERAPDFADAWNTMGVLAFQGGDLAEAERCYRQGAQDRQAFDATLNLGALLLRTRRAVEALDFNQRAVDLRSSDAAANAQVGMNYFQLGRFGEAEKYLAEAKTLDPANQAQPQLFLAEIHRQRGEVEAAVMELRELIQLRPDAAGTLLAKIDALGAR